MIRVEIGDEFEVSKTPDKFFKVKFIYEDGRVWDGALPIYLRIQGFDLSDSYNSYEEYARCQYSSLSTEEIAKWDAKYLEPAIASNTYGKSTTGVLGALRSGEWECRTCGPVPQVNPQAAARLKSLKENGFCIATLTQYCNSCNKSTYHDILVKIPKFEKSNVLKRYAISSSLKTKIYKVYEHREAYFGKQESARNLIIDHKFPSDRWESGEDINSDNMSEEEIKNKFQLLTNQTNMMKSRACSKCVKEGVRGSFSGIKWYYNGNEQWHGIDKYDENGCIGCPWYDLNEWKRQLQICLDKVEESSSVNYPRETPQP